MRADIVRICASFRLEAPSILQPDSEVQISDLRFQTLSEL
jgi:hypothetical protein